MVSTTLTTLVSQQQTSGGQNNQNHHQYQRQQPSSSSTRTTYYYPSSSSSSTAPPVSDIKSPTADNLLDFSAPSPPQQQQQNHHQNHHPQPQSATEAATTALKNELNLLNSSPPLNEQISILFPKCRPKSEYHNGSLSSQNHHHQQQQQQQNYHNHQQPYNNNNIKTPTTVGHIPSSPPPPPSTASSLSSESLSSVTPRISTNPFLSSAAGNASSERYYYPTSSTTHTTSSTTTSASMKHYSNYNGTSTTMDGGGSGGGGSVGLTRKRGSTTNHYYNNNNGSSNNNSCTTNNNNNCSSNNSSATMNGSQNPFIKDNYSYNNSTPASTVLNSPELTDYESRSYYYSHNKIRLGRSPVNRSEPQEHHNSYTSRNYQQQQQQQQHQLQQQPPQTHHSIDLSSPTSSPTEGLNGDRDGIVVNGRDEIVVFDDISENWQNLRVTTPKEQTSFPSTMTTGKINHRDTSDRGEDKPEINNCDIDSYKEPHKRFLDRNLGYKIDSKHGIIEYEGSPRRIGQCIIEEEDKLECITSPDRRNYKLYHTSVTTPRLDSSPPAVHLPLSARPGFPQRVLSTSPPPLIPTTVEQLHHISTTTTPERNQLLEENRILVNDDVVKLTAGDNHNAPLPSIPNTAADDTSNDVSEIGTSSNSEQLQFPGTIDTKSSTFDYLYEFSETRKVLEEFFKCPSNDKPSILENGSDVDSIDIHYEFRDMEDKDDVTSVDIGRMDDDNNSLCNNQHHHHQTEEEEEEDQQLQNHDGDDEDDGEDDDDDDDEDVDEQPLAQSSNNSIKQNNTLKYSRMNGTNGSVGGGSGGGGGGTPFGNLTIDKPCISRNEKLSRRKHHHRDIDFFLDSASRSSCEQQEKLEPQSQRQPHSKQLQQQQQNNNQTQQQQQPPAAHSKQRFRTKSFRYSPDTTDCDSNCGDLDSISGEFNGTGTSNGVLVGGGGSGGGGTITKVSNHVINYTKHANHMPCLEDGLSSGHTSDADNNNPGPLPPIGISMLMDMKRSISSSAAAVAAATNDYTNDSSRKSISPLAEEIHSIHSKREILGQSPSELLNNKVFKNIDPDLDSLYSINVFHRPDVAQQTPPPPAPAPHRKPSSNEPLIKDLRPNPTQRMKPLVPTATSNLLDKNRVHSQPPPVPERTTCPLSPMIGSPVWIPRDDESTKSLLPHETNTSKNMAVVDDEDDIDTDLETDRLLGHQRLDDQGFFDDKKSSSAWERKSRSILTTSLSKFSPKVQPTSNNNNSTSASLIRQGLGNLLTENTNQQPATNSTNTSSVVVSSKLVDIGDSNSSPERSDKSTGKSKEVQNNADSPDGSRSSMNKKETSSTTGSNSISGEKKIKKSGAVLIEGVLFRARYLGSTQLICEGQPTKSTRMMQAEEAVSRIKALAPDGDAQPSTEVDLFISTEKIMVLNTDLKEIMMDHALRTISYIADIGDLVVLMARRRFVPQDIDEAPKQNRAPKMICHVFESDEAQFIAQSIGQAFQVAYMEFLKANGIEDHSFVKEMDYQEVLNSQEIFGDELEIFAKKELQKEVVVPKAKGEILGVVIVESGWGSMLPTVVIANLMSSGAAARCGQLNIGDQLIAINGLSLVGLPLSTCQSYIKNTKNQTVVKFTVVPCAPVVEVKIKRPNTKYQLGFSVQNGVICSLLRGGIAERGGVRVGHRIIEINNQSVVAVPHEKIVNLLATSVGEILMKTMPTSMFRLLTGQENPIYI